LLLIENDLARNELLRSRNRQIDVLETSNCVLDKIVALRVHENDICGVDNDFLDHKGKLYRNEYLTRNMFKPRENKKTYDFKKAEMKKVTVLEELEPEVFEKPKCKDLIYFEEDFNEDKTIVPKISKELVQRLDKEQQ
jgi:hypothetical protein